MHQNHSVNSYLRPLAYASSGIEFGGCVLAFWYGGLVLDRKFGMSPLFMITGLIVGAVAGFAMLYAMFRMISRMESEAGIDSTKPSE